MDCSVSCTGASARSTACSRRSRSSRSGLIAARLGGELAVEQLLVIELCLDALACRLARGQAGPQFGCAGPRGRRARAPGEPAREDARGEASDHETETVNASMCRSCPGQPTSRPVLPSDP